LALPASSIKSLYGLYISLSAKIFALRTPTPAGSDQMIESKPKNERSLWIEILLRVAEPVLSNCAERRLKAYMPADSTPGPFGARATEALGRTLSGIAPWLSLDSCEGAEEDSRLQFSELARQSLQGVFLPDSPDHLNFTSARDEQRLVDAAFLALAISRARAQLWDCLDQSTQQNLIVAFKKTRRFRPWPSNWMLFPAMVEAFLASVGTAWDGERIDAAFKAHELWYKGDGTYGDGANFHWDYYNSFVIHPLLITVSDLMKPIDGRWNHLRERLLDRARRYAIVQERLIAPDGSFPAIGRSLAYRCGAFHHLAMLAFRRDLPSVLAPAQVRCALGSVIRRTLNAPNTFDKNGWLRIGLAGHQPSISEFYISTSSLYLCTLAFLPLGLSPTDEFWTAPDVDWTSRKAWSGHDLEPDQAMDGQTDRFRDLIRSWLKWKIQMAR